jgi:hypothetical protein
MVRRFFSHFFIFCYAYAYKSKKRDFLKRIFYKGLLISKLDIYKCPKTKKILKLFFTKKTHILTYKIYMTIMVRKGNSPIFQLFFKNFAKCKNAKMQSYKVTKLQKRQ